MLQSMRQMAHSWVVKGLMVFLILSFGIWGIGDIFRGNPLQAVVAKVGSASITVDTLNHAFDQMLQRVRQSFNPDLSAAQGRQMGLLDHALDEAIDLALVDQDLKRLNIDVPASAIVRMIGDQPQFRATDGSFNKALFRAFLQQQGLNETSFVAQGQQDTARQVLLNVLDSSRSAPQIEIDALYKARGQKRILDVVTVDAAAITDIPVPDDKVLHDFYDKNPQSFTAPEYRAVTLAALSTDALEKDIAVSDDQLKKAYADKSDELKHPEQRDIVQVVVQDEAKAKRLAEQARALGDLAAAAKANKETAVPLDKMEEKNLLPALATAVFALKSGEIGDPVQTQLGWHVVQVKRIIAAGQPSFDEVKDSLRADLRRDQAIETATQDVNKLDDELAAGHSLDDIADDLGLRLIKIPALDATGMTPGGAAPPEFPDKDTLLKDAFAQNAGDSSPIEDDKKGNYYVVRTDQITPATVKPFDQVKQQVAAAWTDHTRELKAHSEAAGIEKDLRAGKPLSSFAGMPGVSARASTPISALGDSDALLPPALVKQASSLGQGKTAMAAANGKDFVVRVASIADADLSKPDPRRAMIGNEIKQQSGEELLDQYLDHLRALFPVKIHNDVFDQLQRQGN